MTQTDPNSTLVIPPLPTGGDTQPAGTIGVPDGYVPPTRQVPAAPTPSGQHLIPGPVTNYGTTPHGSAYHEGQQWLPQNLPPADVYSLQQQLVQAGYLTLTNVRPGVWDNSSADAYKSVLAFANATGMTASDSLKVLSQNPQNQAAGAHPAPYQLTNPADIAATVSGGGPHQSNTARDLIGKDLPASETNDFEKWYQDQEVKARGQYMAADLAGAGNSYTGAPNLTAAAQTYIKQHNLADTVAYGTASRMLSFFQLLKGVV